MDQNKTPREMAWEWMTSRYSFTLEKLVAATGMNKHTAAVFIRYLRRKNRIHVLRKHIGSKPARYRVHDTSPLKFGTENYSKPKKRRHKICARQRMWTSMRVLRTFTIADVAAGANAKPDQTCRYIRCLVKGGYVRLIHGPLIAGPNKKGEFARFRLLHDSGPRYPLGRKDGLYDQNADKFHAYQEVETASKHTRRRKPRGAQHGTPERRMA